MYIEYKLNPFLDYSCLLFRILNSLVKILALLVLTSPNFLLRTDSKTDHF